MKLESIHINHFRGIEHLHFDLTEPFTLLVGDNGSGKTSILSALAVSLGIWHVSKLVTGPKQWRSIMEHELREVPNGMEAGERLFSPSGEAQITATGRIGNRDKHAWTRFKKSKGTRTQDVWMKKTVADIHDALAARNEKKELLPLLAFYGAGRAWMPSNERATPDLTADLKARPGDGYYDCLNERIRVKDVMQWFVREAAARDDAGKFRAGYHAVRLALLRGIPGIDDLWYDHRKLEIVISIEGKAQPFSRLSDGQRMMAATISDMAVRAFQLNRYMVESYDGDDQAAAEAVLRETHGVVLIDELDVHLHPDWQRRVARDLRATFPKVQFICTSHSPQVCGELRPEEILVLKDGTVNHPLRSFGMDSGSVLEEIMDSTARNQATEEKLRELGKAVDDENLAEAQKIAGELKAQLGEAAAEVLQAETMIHFLSSK